MDFSSLLESLQTTVGQSLPKLLLALATLVVSWLVAVIVRAVVRKSLGLLGINRRFSSQTGGEMNIAVAVAVALSFGLGGREAAGKQMEHWFARLRGERQ